MTCTPNTGAKPNARDTRLRKHADYPHAYKAARKQFSPSIAWFLALRPATPPHGLPPARFVGPTAPPRVGLTVGKVLGKAHERNRIKRRMREAIRAHLAELPAGIDLILHPRRSVLTVEFAKLEAEVVRILQQANVEAARMRTAAAKPAAATPENRPAC